VAPRKTPGRKARLAALARESERAERELIARWQRLPMARRMNFLRKRIGPGRTAL
jgi:hypothetical protein